MKKRYKPFIFIVCVLSIALFTPDKGYSQTLYQNISSDTLSVGDVFSFSITLRKDHPYDSIIYPDTSLFPKMIGVKSRGIYRAASFEDSVQYKLQFWAVSNVKIPSLPVKLISDGDTAILHTQPVALHFRSVLHSKKAELRPLKPLFKFASTPWWVYFSGFIALLILLAYGYYLYRKYKGRAESKEKPKFSPEPFQNPLRELKNNLNDLKGAPLNSEEEFEQFYVELGDAIRLYFEHIYHIPALESTSREIIYDLERRMVDKRLIKQTRFVLRDADKVKFAKFTPTKEHAEETLQEAMDFLEIAKDTHLERVRQMRRQHAERVEKARKKYHETKDTEVES